MRSRRKRDIHSYTEGLMPKKHFASYIHYNINKRVINSQAPSEGAAAVVYGENLHHDASMLYKQDLSSHNRSQ